MCRDVLKLFVTRGLRRNRLRSKALGPKSEALTFDCPKIHSKTCNQSKILPKLVFGNGNVKSLEEMEENSGENESRETL